MYDVSQDFNYTISFEFASIEIEIDIEIEGFYQTGLSEAKASLSYQLRK